MKRSEALTIICNVLLEFSGKRVTNGDTAIKILAELEAAGITPPQLVNPSLPIGMTFSMFAQELALDNLYNRNPSTPNPYYVNQWEPEVEGA